MLTQQAKVIPDSTELNRGNKFKITRDNDITPEYGPLDQSSIIQKQGKNFRYTMGGER